MRSSKTQRMIVSGSPHEKGNRSMAARPIPAAMNNVWTSRNNIGHANTVRENLGPLSSENPNLRPALQGRNTSTFRLHPRFRSCYDEIRDDILNSREIRVAHGQFAVASRGTNDVGSQWRPSVSSEQSNRVSDFSQRHSRGGTSSASLKENGETQWTRSCGVNVGGVVTSVVPGDAEVDLRSQSAYYRPNGARTLSDAEYQSLSRRHAVAVSHNWPNRQSVSTRVVLPRQQRYYDHWHGRAASALTRTTQNSLHQASGSGRPFAHPLQQQQSWACDSANAGCIQMGRRDLSFVQSSSNHSPTSDQMPSVHAHFAGMRGPPTNKRFLSPSRPPQQFRHQQEPLPQETFKKVKGFDKLDLLCTATLEIGEMHDNPTGCSCPKSKCIALYCDCFKAGRRCNPTLCSCMDCKNTIVESGADGARTKAIRCILARNPRAFTHAGKVRNPLLLSLPPGEIFCNCVRSQCLKLYCSCFHNGKVCKPDVCTCVGCRNTEKDDEGLRFAAVQQALEKRPDAFQVKTRELGLGCACKNNRCIRKYCECFRTNLQCTDKCTCRDCENGKENPGSSLLKEQEPSRDPLPSDTCSPMHEESAAI